MRMISKIKNIPKSDIIAFFSDIRNLGLVVFAIIALLVTWSGIKVVQTNYDLQKQISEMQQENNVVRLENSNAALRNQYLQTDEYLELVARKQFNKALPGEKLLIVPESVALSHTIELPESEEPTPQEQAENKGPWYERNFNAWLDFLLQRQS